MTKPYVRFITTLLSLLLANLKSTASLQPTSDPPLLDVPTYSLATKDENGNTGMNILTYATPISIRPDRIWSLGLFRGTVAHENFAQSGEGILQLLSPRHASVVKLLGGSSGRDVDKREECEKLSMGWISMDSNEENCPDVLPHCVHYLKVRRVGELIDCGSHDLAICKVESMFVAGTENEGINESTKSHLKTAELRHLGIITPQGRVAE